MDTDDNIELEQAAMLYFFALAINIFHDKCRLALTKLVFQLHGDNGFFIYNNAKAAIENFYENFNAIAELHKEDEVLLPKSTYYEIWFLVLDKLIPAVKGVESIFGDEVSVEEHKLSDALQELVHNA
jgi:hypothetical protein